jgi:Cys-tRNA synthase (O-phospho-L-seryl-tRNA:Cys-tRNA synthase)
MNSVLIQPYFDYCYSLCDTCNKTLKDNISNPTLRTELDFEVRAI